MAYVPPNSTIKLLSNVPLDIGHSHTLWFLNSEYQYNYFSGKATRTFSNVSYVRKGRGVIKLQCPADQLYGCNYMMYQNTSYSNKWFYAFCYVEYINDNTSQISFIIDNLQTWFFEMQLKQCYVEREHASTDVAGDNLIPEGLETGEYIYGIYYNKTWTTWSVYIITTFTGVYNPNTGTWSFADSGGGKVGGLYSGCEVFQFPLTHDGVYTQVSSFIAQAVSAGLENGIVNVFMFPSFTFSVDGYGSETFSMAKITGSINGYVPRNNKLFTSPYCMLEVSNCEGTTAVFPQEYFSTSDCEFLIETTIGPKPSIALTPKYYKNRDTNYPEALYMTNPLTCSWNTDLYKAYMAQSLTASVVEDVTDMIQGAWPTVAQKAEEFNTKKDALINKFIDGLNNTGAFRNPIPHIQNEYNYPRQIQLPQFDLQGSGVGWEGVGTAFLGASILGGSDVLLNVYKDLEQMYAKGVKAPHNNGTNAGDLLVALHLKGFWFNHRTIRAEYARIIDQYFDRYGYACHRIKVPSIHVRQSWTYTKTRGCEVEGNIPIDAKAEINAVFDSGITFWDASATVGDYTQSNGIIV